MSKLVDYLNEKSFKGIGNCTDAEISDAEQRLKMKFPEEYRDFLRAFKAGSFRGMELMGIGTMAYLDTIINTLEERTNDDSFPKDCFVLENLGIEGMLTVVDEDGIVYSYCNGKNSKLADSLSDYIMKAGE